MAENKYITQTQENGSVLIAEEVLVNIISLAVAEVEGAELSGKPGINWGKGIKLTIEDDNAVTALPPLADSTDLNWLVCNQNRIEDSRNTAAILGEILAEGLKDEKTD